MRVSEKPQRLEGVRELSKYKAVLLDQFGVLHDGREPYSAAIDAVKQWAAAGISVYVLSNSSRRADAALVKISGMGFPKEAFAGAMTSGEVTHRCLSAPRRPPWDSLGTRALHITWSARGAVDVAALHVEPVDTPEAAEFILAHGTEGVSEGADGMEVRSTDDGTLRSLLKRCAELGGRPMVVANPDLVTVDGKELRLMPGSYAKYYEEQGGKAHLMGKPDPIIYEYALEELGVEACEVIAVGDSIEHDIRGAQHAGIDTLFIAGGIHEESLQAAAQADSDSTLADNVITFMKDEFPGMPAPTFVMPMLVW